MWVYYSGHVFEFTDLSSSSRQEENGMVPNSNVIPINKINIRPSVSFLCFFISYYIIS